MDGGLTPLHVAAFQNTSEATIQALIDSGADIQAKDNLNRTPLILAQFVGNTAAVNVLLASGA